MSDSGIIEYQVPDRGGGHENQQMIQSVGFTRPTVFIYCLTVGIFSTEKVGDGGGWQGMFGESFN